VLALFALCFGCVAFYAASCWYIGRHWFGLRRAHPLLGPFVAAVTVCVITGMEVHFDGPGSLPVRSWLLINVCGLVTTVGICVWEFLEYVNEGRGGHSRWPMTLAATAVALTLVPGVLVIADGTAQRLLCGGEAPIAECDKSAGDRPSDVVPSPMPFELRAPGGIDLNASRPTLTNDTTFADIIYDNNQAWENTLRTNGQFAMAEWTLDRAPDRNRCNDLFVARRGRGSAFRPRTGMVLCVETTGGQLASVVISRAQQGVVVATATVWW
jgi:hypothetical protein